MLHGFVLWMLSIALMLSGTGVAFSQDFPNKPIRIVTGTAGSGPDLVLRILAPGVAGALGQPLIIHNTASSNLIGEIVGKAPPEGYTLLASGGQFLFGPLLQKTPYDPVNDFIPVTILDRAPYALVVHPSVPANSVKELIALAKAKPGGLNFGSSGAGSGSHLSAEYFKSVTGINIVWVPYKGGGQALAGLMGNEVQLMIPNIPTVTPHIKSGRLRALAVTSAQPSPLAPGLPTMAASGLPGYESVSYEFLFAPAKTPAAVIKRLNQDFVRVLNQTDVREHFLNVGVEAVSSSPEQAASTAKSEVAKWSKVIKDVGIQIEK